MNRSRNAVMTPLNYLRCLYLFVFIVVFDGQNLKLLSLMPIGEISRAVNFHDFEAGNEAGNEEENTLQDDYLLPMGRAHFNMISFSVKGIRTDRLFGSLALDITSPPPEIS